MQNQELHAAVLIKEVIEYLAPQDSKIYVDCTFGAGGYTNAVLQRANCKVYAIDRDPNVQKIAEKLIKKYPNRLRFIQSCFGKIGQVLAENNIDKVDGIMMDLGVSSMQLDNKERGFSFNKEAFLDMRMSGEGLDAYYAVNNLGEEELANIIYKYGNERKSRRIAHKICEYRKQKQIITTTQLADIIRPIVGYANKKIDPATKTFQAIRIWVNKELEELEQALNASEKLLNIGGKLLVVSFHSLEDSIVKDFIAEKSGKTNSISRYKPELTIQSIKTFKPITKKAISPSDEEKQKNHRSRSAKLRVAEKIAEAL